MMERIKKYPLVYLFIYITTWTALASTPMNEIFHFPTIANQMFSLLLYVPFGVIIAWKLWSDVKSFHLHLVNIIYYLFAFYYAVISAYRLVNHMEVKETVYHAVTLLGSFALFLQIYDGHYKLSKEVFFRNLIGIGLFMAAVKLIITFLEGNFFSLSPLNNLYSTSVLVMLLPVLFAGFREHKGMLGTVCWVLFGASVLLIMICSSRAITLLAIGILGVLMLFTLRKPANLVKFLSAILCAAIVVALMGVCNIGLVRRSLYREFGIRWPVSSSGQHDPENMDSPELSDEELMQSIIDEQIGNSDNMRSALLQQGIQEFKNNPVFGSGDLYYTYDLGYKTMEQTAHNFLVECRVCYGIIGTLPKLKTDYGTKGELEILVGDTNRPESKSAAEGLGEKDFRILFTSEKIAIVGGSDSSTVLAVEYFLDNYLSDGVLSIDFGEDYTYSYVAPCVMVGDSSLEEYKIYSENAPEALVKAVSDAIFAAIGKTPEITESRLGKYIELTSDPSLEVGYYMAKVLNDGNIHLQSDTATGLYFSVDHFVFRVRYMSLSLQNRVHILLRLSFSVRATRDISSVRPKKNHFHMRSVRRSFSIFRFLQVEILPPAHASIGR